MTDILLRKHPQLLNGLDVPSWVNTYMVEGARECQYETEDGTVARLRENRIYYEHPEWIVGTRFTKRGMACTPGMNTPVLMGTLPKDAMLQAR